MKASMIFRFSLYGFLKNQQYYDPFLILAFREKGLSFFTIGILIAFREICINIFEVPSGAIADLHGRRRAMILSFIGYIISFAVFAMSRSIAVLFGAMFFFAIGEVFRTGTHKAIIFEWLRLQDRTDEKTKVYGYTRSWSKIGSALSVVIASALVFYSGNYSHIFWFCIPPYLLGIVNFLSYPAELDGEKKGDFSVKSVAAHLLGALRESIKYPSLRRLLVESMGFDVTFRASKNYLQPMLRQAAISLPLLLALADKQRTALLVGMVYLIQNIFAAIASRQAHRLVDWRSGEDSASRFIWILTSLLFILMIPLLWFDMYFGAIGCCLILCIMQNFWRPLLVGRINTHSNPEMGATVLSIESQVRSFAVMIMAPLLGWLVDISGAFWPMAIVGAVIATAITLTIRTLEDV